LGERTQILQHAVDELNSLPGITIAQHSRWFLTDPIGGPEGQGQFVNGAIRVETSLTAEQLHTRLREVEARLGRQRRQRWAARLIDLDLLLFGDLVLQSEALTIPHPRMAFRRFVLEPAAQVGGDLRHPLIGWTVQQLLDHLNRALDYVALTGPSGAGKTELACQVARALDVRLIEDPAAPLLPSVSEEPIDREIAILRRRAARVDRENWPEDQGGAVSDFWIGQSLAYAAAAGLDIQSARLDGCWQQLYQQAARPKLLVWLDAAPKPSAAEETTRDTDDSSRTRVQQTVPDRAVWRDIIRQYYCGPLLHLDASHPDWAITELTAAIQAMR